MGTSLVLFTRFALGGVDVYAFLYVIVFSAISNAFGVSSSNVVRIASSENVIFLVFKHSHKRTLEALVGLGKLDTFYFFLEEVGAFFAQDSFVIGYVRVYRFAQTT